MNTTPALRYILAPYVATPHDVVERLLHLADVRADDRVFDLGCGDGRVVIAAAKNFGASGVGIDIEPWWIEQANQNARDAGVEERVRFEAADALYFDVSNASVVFVYLVHWSMQKIAPLLRTQLAPGTRVVSLSFPIDDWQPTRSERFVDAEGSERVLHLWVVA